VRVTRARERIRPPAWHPEVTRESERVPGALSVTLVSKITAPRAFRSPRSLSAANRSRSAREMRCPVPRFPQRAVLREEHRASGSREFNVFRDKFRAVNNAESTSLADCHRPRRVRITRIIAGRYAEVVYRPTPQIAIIHQSNSTASSPSLSLSLSFSRARARMIN